MHICRLPKGLNKTTLRMTLFQFYLWAVPHAHAYNNADWETVHHPLFLNTSTFFGILHYSFARSWSYQEERPKKKKTSWEDSLLSLTWLGERVWAWGPTWNDGNSVLFPGDHTDVLLHSWRNEALEDSHVAPHGPLISHTNRVWLPEHYMWTKIGSRFNSLIIQF